jgi:hypothetical protein
LSFAAGIHSFAEVAILEEGSMQYAGRLKREYRRVIDFGKTLKRGDEVVSERSGIVVREEFKSY